MRFLTLLAASGFLCCQAVAEVYLVTSQDEYRKVLPGLQPGDTLQLANGVWKDFEILFTGQGSAGKPITLTAQTKGKVIISGESNLRLAGEHLLVSGLVFKNGYTPTNTVLSFRSTKGQYANNSRVTQVVIDNFNNPERRERDFWVMVYGKNNRFDHNHLSGKRNAGVTMAVRLNTEASRNNGHIIDHNYFGPREPLGSNGGETLRIGTSHFSRSTSGTLVENNYFERCDGEVEIISNKSGGNTFRGNVFFESRGTLTLRHGHGNLIERNIFLGNGVPHTGGIRVINERQTVRNNYLYGLTGHRFGGALVVMNGVPNSPLNRYDPVREALIENNSIIESEHLEFGAGSDEERSAPPNDSRFRNNLIFSSKAKTVIALHDDMSGIDFSGNLTGGGGADQTRDVQSALGLTKKQLSLKKSGNGLFYPRGRSAEGVGAPRDLQVIKRSDTGAFWYPKPALNDQLDTGMTLSAEPVAGALAKAIKNAAAGDIIELLPGQHQVAKVIRIDQPLTIRSKNKSQRASIEFERTALFELTDGGSLKLLNLNISGRSAPDAAGNSVIRTSRYSMLTNYRLLISNVRVSDLNVNHSFNFFTPAKSTQANLISITDSEFKQITGHILPINKEVDDLGIYGAEYIIIRDSVFEQIDGALADIYRGGTDESTFGPHFYLTDNRLRLVGLGKRNKSQAAVNLHGVQDVRITGNRFSGSQPVRVAETVGEPMTYLGNNSFSDTPSPMIRQIK